MKRLLTVASTCLLTVLPLAAGGGAEALKAGSALSFSQSLAVKPELSLRKMMTTKASEAHAAPSLRQAASRMIRLSGTLSLSGAVHVPNGSSWAWITLTGSTWLHDETGRSLTGLVYFSDSQNFPLSGNHISGWARPSASVVVYDNGRYLGTIRVDGSIYVSGWSNGGWVNLSGSGQVSGTGWVSDPTPPQNP